MKHSLPDDEQVVRNVVNEGIYTTIRYCITRGVLVQRNDIFWVVPSHLQKQVLDKQHNGDFAGHFGYKRMYNKMKQYYYWRGMSSDVLKKCGHV